MYRLEFVFGRPFFRNLLDDAKRHNRATKVSFAGIAPLPQQNPKYDRRMYEDAVEKAVRLGCEYFVAPFPEGNYLESMRSFGRMLCQNTEASFSRLVPLL